MTLWIVGEPQAFVGQARYILDGALRTASLAGVRLVSLDALDRELRAGRPTVTLALGDRALRALGGDALSGEGVRALRGYLWDAPIGRVLGTVCPSDIVTDWTPWRALLDFDVRRAKQETLAGAPPLPVRDVTVCTQESAIPELVAAIQATPPESWLSVDIENTHDLQLACVGFAPTPERAWVIPTGESWQLTWIRKLCESPTPKVLQNGQYDRFFLKRFCGIELRAQRFDTQLAWHALNPELAGKKTEVGYKKAKSKRTAKSLKFLASLYTRDSWWKDYEFTSAEERFVLCGKDVCVTLEIANKMSAQLEAA